MDLAKSESDKSLQDESFDKLQALKAGVKKLEIKCFLSNDSDNLNSYLEFHAGAGGTESQDWAEMLRRMYMKWASNKGYSVELISEHKGDEAGIKSSTIKISGDYIYGYLKAESGIHRLVRISPFDSGARRHTSFASVWIYPVVDDKIDIEIIEKDLRIDTYRSSGAGGQHVNTTDNIESSKSDIGWGHQIRSYVLHPYQMVKDNRTNFESSNPEKILDGEIDNFLEISLYKINA